MLLGSFVCLCLGFFFTSSFPLAQSPQWEQWDRAAACAGRAGEGLGGCIDHGKSGPKQFPPQELQALLDSQSHPRQQISGNFIVQSLREGRELNNCPDQGIAINTVHTISVCLFKTVWKTV